MTTIEQFWLAFRATLPDDAPAHQASYVAEPFGDNPALADELVALVLDGVKTATCSALWEWEAEGNPIPQPGAFWIVLDGRGAPRCIVETVEVTMRRYDEVDAEFAAAEGEGDRSLAYWRAAHERFFTRTLGAIGKDFTPEMPLVCERFRVVYQAVIH
jgi:uncharacterized protein YhfF